MFNPIIVHTRANEQIKEKTEEVLMIGIKKPKYPTKAIDMPAIAEMHEIQ